MENSQIVNSETSQNIQLPKVLVVDDREANVIAMQRVLEALDCEIVEAFSGEEALSSILKNDFAAILMDVQMPGMDGFETAGLIRAHRESARIPIIFVTAISKEDRYIQEGYGVGAVDYLFKPIDPLALMSKVQVFIDLYNQKYDLQMAMDELKSTQDALLASNQRLSDFSHTVAHDLRNPLGAIMGFARVLQRSLPDDTEQRSFDCLQRITTSSEKMNRMITGILDQAGQQSVVSANFETVDLNAVISDVVDSLHFKLLETNGSVNFSDLPIIDADATHMWQLFANLISNAIKYQREGVPPVVDISVDGESDESVVRLVVRDNGIGFTEGEAKVVFEKFSRLDGSAADVDGYGIGLSTVYKIVEEHGGVISAVGRKGEGADFVVELPKAQEKPGRGESNMFASA